jgi:hypothetical protein
MPPKLASASETTGLKCPPDTGPNIRMIVNSPAAVAAAFSNNWRPTRGLWAYYYVIPDALKELSAWLS